MEEPVEASFVSWRLSGSFTWVGAFSTRLVFSQIKVVKIDKRRHQDRLDWSG